MVIYPILNYIVIPFREELGPGLCDLDDFVRLQQNITGHVLMKHKLKHADTVFIGLTEQDDLLITVKLETGKVWLEYVGKRPHHVLADSLEEFLSVVAF
ncbi:hypothetical protein MTsN2n4_04130 [Pseudoalteromonas sp. MTN2-4]